MTKLFSQTLPYVTCAILVVPVAIISHELGHFASYMYFRAENVRLLAFSVSAKTEHLSASQIAVSNIVGPIITYLTVIIAALMIRKQYSSFWVILAIAAPIGRIVNGVYIYFRVLGYSPNPNFDEYNFSRCLNVDPLLVSIPTLAIVVTIFYSFGRKAWKHGGYQELGRIILSILIGIAFWSTFGPLLLR